MPPRRALLIAALAAIAVPAAQAEQAVPPADLARAEFAGEPRAPVAAVLAAVAARLSAEFDLPPAPPPAVRFSSPAAMAALHHGDGAGGAGRRVIVLYDHRSGTIHLPEGWSGASAVELSMLVHEMVHHLQARRVAAGLRRRGRGTPLRGAGALARTLRPRADARAGDRPALPSVARGLRLLTTVTRGSCG
jgi:hypothetical protein